MVENYINWIDETTVAVMGNKFRWFAPYTGLLFLYLGIGNLLSLLGFMPIASSYSVVLTFGLLVFVGIFVSGIWFNGLKWFLKFVKNPLEIITQFSPFISITFRIFGNMIAGTTILYLVYLFCNNLYDNIFGVSSDTFRFNFILMILAPPFHFYFDIFDGLIQSFIFTLLSMSYIAIEAEIETVHQERKKTTKIDLDIKKDVYYANPKIDIVRTI
ncbi:F0F1 ATP synthase subunit A [symbiont of Argiope bruennichi]|uniref:FoF1 ATP synthase subunit A n=1 Tax=symbiont of Argiope bruennichi TaxID=2810479 RepID=UPI003DA50BF6